MASGERRNSVGDLPLDVGRADVPLVDLQTQYRSIRPSVDAAIRRVLERQVFVGGPETKAFESEFARFCEAPHSVALSNGTTALELVFEALGIGPGDEVVTVSHTFIATVGAILRTGATAVLVDIREDDWTMSPSAVAEAVGPRTKAIVPVHIYGHPADVPAIAAAAPGIPIVEDAAQAHGARYHGEAVGSRSVAACFSFYPGKNLGAYGDAGAVITRDEVLAKRLRALRNHGRVGGKYEHRVLGTNARASEIQAAVLRAKLPYLRAWTEARRGFARRYEDRLSLPGTRLQTVQPWAEHARHLFVLLHPERDRLLALLRRQGIEAGIHYPLPVHRQAALQGRPWRAHRELAVTDRVSAECLSLPLSAELGIDGVDRVLAALAGAAGVLEPDPRRVRSSRGANGGPPTKRPTSKLRETLR
jgi:dTDP-3-amino-3,4,6-trideoxy-alpha-D-glucose transaminase